MSSEIKRWQRSVARDADSETSSSKQDGFASRLSRAACKLFRLFLEQGRLETTGSDHRALSRVYSYLQLWCDGYGVSSGDLDAALSESKKLRHATYRLLVSICHTLADKMAIALCTDVDDDLNCGLHKEAAWTRDLIEEATFANADDDGGDSASDSGSDTSSITGDYNVQEIIKDLETDIRCLVDLGPRYKEPIRDRTVKEQPALPSLTTNWDPAEHFASRIRHRYPDGNLVLAHTLGQMNWERAKRLYAAREANARATERPAVKLSVVPGAKGTIIASDFHDSGLGTTLASPTSYAETVLSYRGTKSGSIKIPQVPPEGMKGERFICGICGCTCQLPKANWKSSWKRHVFSDLEPYVCVMAECKFSHVPFPHKTTWIQHLRLEHDFPSASKQTTCPLCQERIGSGEIAHLVRHLEEVSLTILPTNAESDDESDENPEEAANDEPNIPHGTGSKPPMDQRPPGSGLDVLDVSDPGEKHGKSAWSRAIALCDLTPARTSELPLVKGQNLWILKAAEKSPGAAWIPAMCDQGQRQGWVPRSYAKLIGDVSAVEGDGATAVSPEPPYPSTEFEFHRPWGESYQATLPSAFPPLAPLGEIEQTLADPTTASGSMDKATVVEATSPPHAVNLLEELKQERFRQNPHNNDFVLFEGVRDHLVYFPPLVENREGPRAPPAVPEKDAAYGNGPHEGPHLEPPSPITCPEPGCSYATLRPGNLRRHQQIHGYDGEEWCCMEPGCATKWPTSGQLSRHRAETHEKPEVHTEAKLDDLRKAEKMAEIKANMQREAEETLKRRMEDIRRAYGEARKAKGLV